MPSHSAQNKLLTNRWKTVSRLDDIFLVLSQNSLQTQCTAVHILLCILSQNVTATMTQQASESFADSENDIKMSFFLFSMLLAAWLPGTLTTCSMLRSLFVLDYLKCLPEVLRKYRENWCVLYFSPVSRWVGGNHQAIALMSFISPMWTFSEGGERPKDNFFLPVIVILKHLSAGKIYQWTLKSYKNTQVYECSYWNNGRRVIT